jgi:hypothetical protein
MKKITTIIIFISWTFVQAQLKEIKIFTDTLDISINGNLRKVALYKDNFYCMFETNRENTSQSFKKMIVVNKKGDFIEDVFIPTGIQDMNYYDIEIENDSLFIKRAQFNEETYLLGKYVANFEKTRKRNFKLFEDNAYNIYSTCNGEWGGTIFFQDKKTQQVFEVASTCPIVVNKIENEYFITNYLGHLIGFASIIKISDPNKLQNSKLNFDKEEGSKHIKGSEILLDTTDIYIPTSFVYNRQLFSIYSDKEGTYIGQIENGEIITKHQFDFKFYAQYNQQNKKGEQVLGFNIPDSEYKGVLIISGNNLNFYFIK